MFYQPHPWRQPTAANVFAQFDNHTTTLDGVPYRFTSSQGNYYIEAGKSKDKRKYRVHSVAGITPLQQFLIETEPGKLQSHDAVWDTVKKRWYHLYPGDNSLADDGMHWTGPYKNWNSRCAVCHATNYKTDYDFNTKAYRSEQTEMGVGCEACHGPGSLHIKWAEHRSELKFKESKLKGFAFQFDPKTPAVENESCAPCHSRREPLSDETSPPGEPFANHYHLTLLRDGLYYPDGQIRDEVYVYGSFLQSKMHNKGVRCSNCHDSHSGRLKAEGNAVCTQCHNQNGNPLFPSLAKKVYDTDKHHFHKPESLGSQCVSCHMADRVYMGVDARRDHSFRIPRPDLSISLNTPNACTACHIDKSSTWANQHVKKWHPKGNWLKKHFGEIFKQASGPLAPKTELELLGVADDIDQPAIVRATALNLLNNSQDKTQLIESTKQFLTDPSELVRVEAITL